MKKNHTAPALQRGLQILEVLAEAREPLKLSILAKHLGHPVTSIQRMVNQLTEEGYILKNSMGGYYLSNKLYRIAHDNESEGVLLQASMPGMHDFVQASGESIHLSVAVIDQFVVIGQLAGTKPVQITVRPGSYPIEQLPSGKVLLVYGAKGTDLEHLHRIEKSEREAILQKGYCYGHSMSAEGVHHLSVPVLLKNGKCIGAATTSFTFAPGDKQEERIGTLAALLEKCTESIKENIG